MNARSPSWLTLFSPKRRVGRGFSGVEERTTRFAWPRAISVVHIHRVVRASASTNSHVRARAASYTRVYILNLRAYVWLRVLRVADPLAWIIKVLNLVSHCGLIITTEHHASPQLSFSRCSPLLLASLHLVQRSYIHEDPNSVIKRNWFRAALRKNRMLPPIETSDRYSRHF